MKCSSCEFYRSGYQYNSCSLTESECFKTQDNCDLINDDGSVNYRADFFSELQYGIKSSESEVTP